MSPRGKVIEGFSVLLRWLSSLIAKKPLRYAATGFFTFAARGVCENIIEDSRARVTQVLKRLCLPTVARNGRSREYEEDFD